MERGISCNIPGPHQPSKERGDLFSGKLKSNPYEHHSSSVNATLPLHPSLSVEQLKHLSVCHKYLSSFKVSTEISNYMFRKCYCLSPTAKPSVRQTRSEIELVVCLCIWTPWFSWELWKLYLLWKPRAVCSSCLTDSSEFVGHPALHEPKGPLLSALGRQWVLDFRELVLWRLVH